MCVNEALQPTLPVCKLTILLDVFCREQVPNSQDVVYFGQLRELREMFFQYKKALKVKMEK